LQNKNQQGWEGKKANKAAKGKEQYAPFLSLAAHRIKPFLSL